MKYSSRAIFWLVVYFLLVLGPLALLLVGPRPAGREFWREFSVALGFAGLSLMGLQFIPTARLPFLADVFPMDALYSFHHRISIASFALILAHPLILFLNNPFTLRLLNVFTAPGRARAGVIAALLLIVLIVASIRRLQLAIPYDYWRIAHAVLALSITVLAFVHIFGVNYHTSSPIQRIVWYVLIAIWALMILYVHLIKPLLLLWRPYRVKEVIRERGDSWTLALEPVGHAGLTFRPGQVAWLTVHNSPFSFHQHPFSFASSAERPRHLEFTIRELGDFTSTVKYVAPGEKVYVDGPYGTFDLARHPDAPGYVFIAGGIGSAPIMSMLRTMADRGEKRPLYFFYGNWSWDTVIFREELETLRERLNLHIIYALEAPPEGWQGEKGYITREVLDRHLPPERKAHVYFICGPLPMMIKVEKSLRDLGVPLAQLNTELYEMA